MTRTPTNTTATTITVREYLRVSFDGSGRERSNDEQHADNTRYVDRHPELEWSGLPAYRDVGSASGYQRKRRADFDRLMSDLAEDRFGADALLVWVNSRGSRKPEEIMALLTLCTRKGIRIAVSTHDRVYDPANAHDWGSLLKESVDDALYSAKISEAVCRATRANAEAGLHHGGRRPFGYTPDGKHEDVAEGDVIRECVRRVLGGDTVRSIAKDLNTRGILTAAGLPWHPGPLANILRGTRIAGIRTHHGTHMDTPAEWPAIIDRDTHRRVVAVLASRTPVGRRGRTPWLLTGLLRCELCDTPLVSQQDTRGTRRYICRKGPGYKGCGGLVIKAEPTEELLRLLVEERLVDVAARRAAGDHEDQDDAAELTELNRIAAQRVEVADAFAAGRYANNTNQRWEDIAALDRAQRAIEQRLASKVRATGPLDLVYSEGLIGREWADLSRDEQRLILAALIDHVTVPPAAVKGSKRYDPSRVAAPGRITWKV